MRDLTDRELEFDRIVNNFEPTTEWIKAYCFALETDDRRHGEVAELVLSYFVDAGLLSYDEKSGTYSKASNNTDKQ